MLVLATTLLNKGRGRSFIAKSKKSKKIYLIKTKPARDTDYKMWKTRLEFKPVLFIHYFNLVVVVMGGGAIAHRE